MAAPSAHQLAWVAAGLRRAAAEAGVELPIDYSHRVAADALSRAGQVALTRLGAGVVIHTAPDTPDRLPEVLGYADAAGQWYRDGSRHRPCNASVVQGVRPGLQGAGEAMAP